ncbi:MAG: LacI family DNA-binding transcriptional regulator [Lentisphaeria bacterium]|nr:LacI family DNA-binding transcriptional regulator [Lentisphaeria bacterium]
MKEVTIRDVAKLANCSHTTVSRVLNDDPRVERETRERVIAALRGSGYRAGGSREPLIALLISATWIHGYVNCMIASLLWELKQRGNRVELIYADDIELLNSRSVSGAVAVALDSGLNERWRELPALPLVRLNAPGDHFSGICSVNSDVASGMQMAVRHLAEHGHRKILFLGEVPYAREMQMASRRYEGFCRAMNNIGEYDLGELSFFPEDPTDYPDMHTLLDRGITAAICPGEHRGPRVMQQLYRQKIRVPEDLSIIAMEAPLISGEQIPPLTVIAQNFNLLAARAVELLDGLIAHRAAVDITVPCSLIVRESVRDMKLQ